MTGVWIATGAVALGLAMIALGLGLGRRGRGDRRVWHIGSGRQPFLPPSGADDAGSQVGQRPYMPARRTRR